MAEDLSLNAFTSIDETEQVQTYIRALEAFDRIGQLQELKQLARATLKPGGAVLDVGCGFGLETMRLAEQAGRASTCGIDKSARFIEEARRRAKAANLAIDYEVGSADALPYADASFDHVRAERLLIYFGDVRPALAEMRRVLRPGGTLALIEPDFGTTTVNLPDRNLVRRVMAHEADTAVAQSWLPGRLPAILAELGFSDVAIATRVLVFGQDLAVDYFLGTGRKAAAAGAISEAEHTAWKGGIADLRQSEHLFGSEGYFLFTCR
jgi:SAM-dependent methyltransferase